MESLQRILILNGTLAGSGSNCSGSLAICNGKIEAAGDLDPGNFPGYEIMDATGHLILPGGFDPHVHMALPSPAGPSCDEFRTGSRAALAGGTTFLMDFVTPQRGQGLQEAMDLRLKEAALCECGYGLHMGISEWNPRVEAEAGMLAKQGIRSFKAYLAYNKTIGIGYEDLEALMRTVGATGAVVMVHCEDGPMIAARTAELLAEGKTRPCCHALSRPPEAEVAAITRVIQLAARTGCRTYIVHISTGAGANLVADAKAKGIPVFAETCTHYLLFDDSVYDPGRADRDVLPFILSPPIRTKEDKEILWERLADGTIDVVATDHCPFRIDGQKDRGLDNFTRIPNGAGGVGERLEMLYAYGVATGRITLSRFTDLVSARPAEIFGYGNRKGRLAPGMDADLVLWSPKRAAASGRRWLSACDYSLYEGMESQGSAEAVLTGGRWFDFRS